MEYRSKPELTDFSAIRFYQNNSLVGNIGYDSTGTMSINPGNGVLMRPSGNWDFSNANVIGLDYASVNHDHDDDYVKSYTGQDLSITATETGIAISKRRDTR